MQRTSANDLSEKIADADQRGNEWLAKARQAKERGNEKRAEECYRKGNYWLDRFLRTLGKTCTTPTLA